MRNMFHISISSHDEVMYRDEDDLIYGFNTIALAAYETESRLLADAELTTHNHQVLSTDYPDKVVSLLRYSYSKYFNAKYHRSGRLGERAPFITPLIGIVRQTTAISYVNRQALHHGLSSTPFGYRYCSANVIFQKELGKEPTQAALRRRRPLISRSAKLPESFRFDEKGMILREDALDVAYVQELYITPRNFLFQMNRFTDEAWIREQSEESEADPFVTLDVIEKGVEELDMKKLLINEKGRLNKELMTDLEICSIIDKELVPRYSENETSTIYDLDMAARRKIGNEIWRRYGPYKCNLAQIRRCAVIL